MKIEFAKSRVMRACVPTWSTCQLACVLAWFAFQQACVPVWFTCQYVCVPKACQKRANFSLLRANKRANVPYGVPMFQLGVSTCQN